MEFAVSDEEIVQCYWLIPITEQEREFKGEHGLDALEEHFEKASFNYLIRRTMCNFDRVKCKNASAK